MGDASGSRVSKGPVCHYLDELSKRQDACEKLSALRAALAATRASGYDKFVKVFRQHVFDQFPLSELPVARKDAIDRYLQDNWFNTNGWWPQLQPIEPAFCVGMIKALDVAMENCPNSQTGNGKKNATALPIDGYWIVAESGFEVTVMRNNDVGVVNLLFVTPPPPLPRAPEVWAEHKTEIWTVRDAGAVDEDAEPWQRVDDNDKDDNERITARGTVVTSKARRLY